MSWLNVVAARFFGSLRHRRAGEALDAEVRAHLEMLVEENVGRGLSSADARYAALRTLGNLALMREDYRSQKGLPVIETLAQDIRYALRQLRRSPGFAAVAILTLALGVGANTAIFSVVNTVLLRPLPYRDAGRLVMVWGNDRAHGYDTDQVSPPDFRDWQSQNHVFEAMAGSTDVMYTLTGAGEPAPIIGYEFSAEYFRVLGVTPLLGRTFTPEEDQEGKDHVAVLGYRLWQSRFGGDRSLVGRAITLNGAPYTVVGIMPAAFPDTVTQLWTPLIIPRGAEQDRNYRFLRVAARLKPGVTLQQAQTGMNTIAARLSNAYPRTNKDEGINVMSMRQNLTGDIRAPLLVLLCAVGFVLLIACANVANLVLARAMTRQKEVAVRTALGASRNRLLRQLLTESAILGVAGGALGLLLAYWATSALVAMFPPTIANLSIPRIDRIPIDGPVLAFALGASLLTVLIFGLAPALQACGLKAYESLKESGRSLTGSRQGRRFRRLLATLEVALSLILLAAAGLTLKSLLHLLRGNLGLNPDHVLSMRMLLPDSKYPKDTQQLAFGNQALDQITSLPGVQSAGTVTFLPLSGWWGVRNVALESSRIPENQRPQAVWSSVTPDYFRTMNIPLLKGRYFADSDHADAARVAIISATLARRIAPNADPVGRRIVVAGVKNPVEVVGVVGDVHQLGMTSDETSEVYLPFAQLPSQLICFAIRTATDPDTLARAAQRAIWSVDKDQAVSYVMSMTQLASESLAPERVVAILLGIFAALALTLAAIGLYGVISCSASQRTHEIGIRMALGASRSEVLRLVVFDGLRLTALGLALGLAGSLLLAHLMSSLLYGVAPRDPATLAGVAILLAVVALLASYIPARRAMRVDPMAALRYE
ncbi:MAG TPA: ABC transporter permease [Terriglobia bacterium]|nr:ABC transporter permease [Terriglobia bacterium]